MSKKNSGQESTSTALSVTSSVPDVIQAIQAKIANLKHIQESVYVTSKKINGAGGQLDVEHETDTAKLVVGLSSVLARAEAIDKAYAALGFDESGQQRPITKVDGYTVEDWVKDIKLRMEIISQKDTLDELNSLQKEWEELMDKDDRKAMLLKKMQKFAE